MKVVTYNIQYGKGRDGRYDIDRTSEALEGADIVGLQEVEAFWDRSGNIDQARHIAGRLGGFYVANGATVDIHKEISSPDGKVVAVRRQFGNAILSRWPILTSRVFLFPKLSPINGHSIQRGVIEATIDTPLGLTRVYSTHLSHLCEEERMQHARLVIETHRRAVSDGPVSCGWHPDTTWLEAPPPPVPEQAILMGDLNITPDSPVYTALTGPVSDKYGRLTLPDHFVDCWVRAGNPEDSGPTAFYGDEGWKTKTGDRIDYVLATPGLADRVDAAEVLTDTPASDHQPVCISFKR